MIIDVLALGETIKQYDNANNIRIGVNDILRYYKCNHIVIVNPITSFIPERRKYIKQIDNTIKVHTIESMQAHCKSFFNNVVSYEMDYALNKNSHAKNLDIVNNFYHSRTSPFIAVLLAFKFGAKTIRLFGVDLNTHYAYSTGNLSILELRCWSVLFKALKKNNIDLIIPKESKLFKLWST